MVLQLFLNHAPPPPVPYVTLNYEQRKTSIPPLGLNVTPVSVAGLYALATVLLENSCSSVSFDQPRKDEQ